MILAAQPSGVKTAAKCLALVAVFVCGLGLAAAFGLLAVQLRFGGAGAIWFGLECGAVLAGAMLVIVSAISLAARTKSTVRCE